jgi:hypothetical protein
MASYIRLGTIPSIHQVLVSILVGKLASILTRESRSLVPTGPCKSKFGFLSHEYFWQVLAPHSHNAPRNVHTNASLKILLKI